MRIEVRADGLHISGYDVRCIAIIDGVDSANGIIEMSGIRNLFNDMYARDTSKKIWAFQRAKGERGNASELRYHTDT